MTGLRRLCAAIVILGVFAPSGAGAAVAAHELFEHGSFAAIDAVSLAALFHGHRHSPGAPDHDHALVKPSSPARTGDGRFAQQAGSPFRTSVTAPKLIPVVFALHRPSLATGSGPPPGIPPLRV